uniref:F-box domain-containing protein n=1 Tax=Mycena chlorophos TaxID=658473 RepID=A0ABQ0M229_MYCCL|nr:predicted protein [Mycena chlorophos]
MLFDELVPEVLLLVCFELDLQSIYSLREVSRFFDRVTRTRVLWLTLLQNALNQGAFIPRYIENHSKLDSHTLESLVHRLTALVPKWSSPTTSTSSPTPLMHRYLPLSVTWTRLIAGNWLFVASSDDLQSQLSCYDLADLDSASGTTHAYLPGRVRTALTEIQANGIVLALGLTHEAHAVYVITLRKRDGRNVFCELARLEGSSHVLMLSGDFVGCAVRGGLNIPHLFNWRAGAVYELAPPPGGLDIPARRCVPHLMTLWNDQLVVVRAHCIEIYQIHHETRAAAFRKAIEVSVIWEINVGSPPDAPTGSLHFVALSPAGIELLSLRDLDAEEPQVDQTRLIQMPCGFSGNFTPTTSWQEPFEADHPLFCNLRVGASGRRMLWTSAVDASIRIDGHPLSLVQAPIAFGEPVDNQQMSTVFAEKDPALWGLACVDFDDALGLVVVGNIFGELAVFDYGSEPPMGKHRWTKDLADCPEPLPPPLPSKPIPLDLLPALERFMTDEEICKSRASKWGKCERLVPRPRREATPPPFHDYFPTKFLWEGIPCDEAWLLDRLYGFPGEVLVQTHCYEGDSGSERVVFCVGDRVLTRDNDVSEDPFSWPLVDEDVNASGDPDSGDEDSVPALQPPICATALTTQFAYTRFFAEEADFRVDFLSVAELGLGVETMPGPSTPLRNRWEELRARGGRPPGEGLPRTGMGICTLRGRED